MTSLPKVIARNERAGESYKRLDKIFCLEKERIDGQDAISPSMKGDIQIKNLTFHYPECLDDVLKDINIEIEEGQTLGIIGEVGSGKTTLMNLLLKLYQVGRDKIVIGGIDITDIPIDTLRENICYITQDNFLFSTTLKENIRLFKENYQTDEIEESAKRAVIHEEIMDMPQKIDTIIGERGTNLSGGQKQRVAISRAFLRKSSIVIFDDTFSALDNKTEEALLQNIRKLTKDKTCIIISNRISDLKHSDNIIVLDHGSIMETGTHEELIHKKGRYYDFYIGQATRAKDSMLA